VAPPLQIEQGFALVQGQPQAYASPLARAMAQAGLLAGMDCFKKASCVPQVLVNPIGLEGAATVLPSGQSEHGLGTPGHPQTLVMLICLSR